jgi:hypothetical protein
MQRLLRNIGVVLLLLGASSFIWPLISDGRRRGIMAFFGEHERTAAIASIAVGAVVFGLSFRKKKGEEKK